MRIRTEESDRKKYVKYLTVNYFHLTTSLAYKLLNDKKMSYKQHQQHPVWYPLSWLDLKWNNYINCFLLGKLWQKGFLSQTKNSFPASIKCSHWLDGHRSSRSQRKLQKLRWAYYLKASNFEQKYQSDLFQKSLQSTSIY